jgi:hypothetical protein
MSAQSGFANLGPAGPVAAPEPIPTYTLFDSTSVTIATLLGSPVAGTGLLALNYQRLGKKNAAIATLATGIAATGIAIAFGDRVPTYATTGIAVGLLVTTMNLAKSLQGQAVQQHVLRGGPLGSRWAAAGLGLLLIIVILGGAFLVGYQLGGFGSKVVIGSKDEVFYSGSATKQDALALGQALKDASYFLDRGVTARISKGPDGTTVGFVAQDGMWDRADIVSGYEEIGREIAPAIGGFPIQLRLMNSAEATKKQLVVGKVIIGTQDVVYYYGSATEAEASALGQSLKSAGFFRDSGLSIFLSKGDEGTAITFVVEEGAWNIPEKVTAFEALVRQSARAVGGLPIQLRFVNTRVELQKAETVN